MAKQSQREQLTPVAKLSIRISNMINSPQAQARRSVLVHRLDTDTNDAWGEVMMALAETEGVSVAFQDDGNALISWEPQEVERVEEEMASA